MFFIQAYTSSTIFKEQKRTDKLTHPATPFITRTKETNKFLNNDEPSHHYSQKCQPFSSAPHCACHCWCGTINAKAVDHSSIQALRITYFFCHADVIKIERICVLRDSKGKKTCRKEGGGDEGSLSSIRRKLTLCRGPEVCRKPALRFVKTDILSPPCFQKKDVGSLQ